MIIITARNILKPGKKEKFYEAVRSLIEASRAEEGNISYDLYEDIADRDAVCFIESWIDAASIDAHNRSGHFTEWIEKKQLFVERSEVNKYIKME